MVDNSFPLDNFFFCGCRPVLGGEEQLQYLQHLLYLLPPCNCDTLLRLLTFLHTVHSFAQDSVGANDEEVSGATSWSANILFPYMSRPGFYSLYLKRDIRTFYYVFQPARIATRSLARRS